MRLFIVLAAAMSSLLLLAACTGADSQQVASASPPVVREAHEVEWSTPSITTAPVVAVEEVFMTPTPVPETFVAPTSEPEVFVTPTTEPEVFVTPTAMPERPTPTAPPVPTVTPRPVIRDSADGLTAQDLANGFALQITFETDSDQISRGDSKDLSLIAALADDVFAGDTPAGTCVEVHGHVDEQGEPDHNLRLAGRRAGAVVSELEGLAGVDACFEPIAHGEDDLFDPSCRGDCAQNRVVVFKLRVGG